MKTLQARLGAMFKPTSARMGDPQRKVRELARALAKQLGVEVERLAAGGFNVWPPRGMTDEDDPFAGDQYATDWQEALQHLQAYEKARVTTGSEA